jgi:glycosyltransferase involved in cell wall biosynthesis
MKVAFYCPMKPMDHPNPSGDREIARELYDYLLGQGANVFVLSQFRSLGFFRSLSLWGEFFIALVAAYRLCKRERPDVFFVYHLYYKAPDPIAILLALWFRKPYVVFEAMYARKSAREGLNWIGYLFVKLALSYSRAIFSNKKEDFAFLQKWFPAEKVFYLPPSLDLRRFAPVLREGADPDSGPLIVSVAMLRPDRKTQGVVFLLDCLKDLRAQGLKFRWLHLGGGTELQKTRLAASEALGTIAEFAGVLERSDVMAHLGRADLFAFPGIDEGFGLVYLEAQAMALPVVAFRNGGVPDAVGPGGILTTPFDRQEYCAALRMLMENRDERRARGLQGRSWIEKEFQIVNNYKKLWRALGGID